jgi:hypothetical protein
MNKRGKKGNRYSSMYGCLNSFKRGQITLFVIIAILIIAGVSLTLYLARPAGIPSKLVPAENKILECVADVVNEGADVLGSQGGYIETPEFEPGSDYSPFGNQMDFFGSMMPFWIYKSGNGIYKEQVPSLTSMASQLESYVNEHIAECDLSGLEEQGYSVEKTGEAKTKVIIRENEIYAELNWPVTISFEGTAQRITAHKTNVKNNLGSMFSTAKKIYDSEKNSLFLEDYAIDVLVLYAPGTDVDLSCAPKIWSKQQVSAAIREALKANMQTIKFSGDYYKLAKAENKYFVYNLGEKVNNQVNVVYDSTFPTKIEISPSDGDMMRADPVGNQEGLGLLGFCYVPYHFVYSVMFPVIIQVFDENYKMFQFPMTAEIRNNLPRNAAVESQPPELENNICRYSPQLAAVSTRNEDGDPVEADIKFKCDGTVCNIGKTKLEEGEAVLESGFPQCANGFVIAKAEGYAPTKLQFSTNEETGADIILRPLYNLSLKIYQGNSELSSDESAIIAFSSEESAKNVFFPLQKNVELEEDFYTVSVYLFKEGKITLSAQTSTQCVNAPQSGILGMLGFQTKQCYDMNIPEQTVTKIISGGGNAEWIASLREKDSISIYIPDQKLPSNVIELQEAYSVIEANQLEII